MGNVTTVGLDIAKNVFQVHGVDGEGVAVIRQRLIRRRMLKILRQVAAVPDRCWENTQ